MPMDCGVASVLETLGSPRLMLLVNKPVMEM